MGKLKKSTIKHLAKQKNGKLKPGKSSKKFTKKIKAKRDPMPQTSKKEVQLPDVQDDEEEEDDMDIDEFLNTDILDMPNPTEDPNDDISDDDDDNVSISSSEDEEDLKPVDDEEEEEPVADDDAKKGDEEEVVQVTVELIKSLEQKAFKEKSRVALSQFMRIYASACTVKDATTDEKPRNGPKYVIGSSVVYNRIMVSILRHTHETLAVLLSSEDDEVEISERPGWKRCSSILRLFFKSTCALLKQVTDKNIQKFILRNLEPYIKYIVALPGSGDRLLQVLLHCWSSVGGEDSQEDDVCMLAFLRIRELALALPFPFIEKCLKGIYLSYQRRAKFTNETSMRAHTLMGNCIVELYSIDLTSSYQHAFVYIREMALALRRAIMSKTTDALKKVLNWQFCNGLKVWTAVLCAHPKSENSAGLQALLYPLSQLIYGTIRLIPTARYFPLRFHCISMLQQLAASTNSFIPTTSVLLDVLNSKEINRRTKGGAAGGNVKPIDFNSTLKLSKTLLDSPQTQDALVSKTIALLNVEMDIYKFNIGFPELVVPMQLSLRKFNAKCRVPRWTTMVKGVIQSSEKRAHWVTSKRSNVDFSPKDVTRMETFLSSNSSNAKERLAISTADQQKHEEKVYQQTKPVAVSAPAPSLAAAEEEEEPEEEEVEDEEDIVQDIEWSSDEE